MEKDWIKSLIGESGLRFLKVEELINQAIKDPEQQDKVSVMNLMCGTGKSSAVSIIIAETIQAVKDGRSNEGILIVSDTKRALKRYLEPTHMPELEVYLEANSSMISRMDEDTFPEEKFRYRNCPVMLMTYARYFGCTQEQIKKRYLKWKGGYRTCIIMDEQPPIIQFIGIGNREIALVEAALRSGLAIGNVKEREWGITQWEKLRNEFFRCLDAHITNPDPTICYFFQNPIGRVLEENDLGHFIALVEDNREAIEEEDSNILLLLDAILRIIKNGAYGYRWTQISGNVKVALCVVRNNRNLVTNLGTKVIILDGTADIASLYNRNYMSCILCEEVNTRTLDNLTIKFIHINTSKNAFKNKKIEIVNYVSDYLKNQMVNTKNIGLITYINEPEKAFVNEGQYTMVEHLGNTRGRNDMSSYFQMAQVGVNRKPALLYMLEHNEKINDDLNGEPLFDMLMEIMPPEEIPKTLRKIIEDENSAPNELMICDVATDLEQNIFRTAIRNPENSNPVTYYVFLNTKVYSKLVEFIYDRFQNKYGAQVLLPDPTEEMIKSIRQRNSAAHRLIDWLSGLNEGYVFTRNEMLAESGITLNQFRSLKKDRKIIANWFEKMNAAITPSVKGRYKMTGVILRYLKSK